MIPQNHLCTHWMSVFGWTAVHPKNRHLDVSIQSRYRVIIVKAYSGECEFCSVRQIVDAG
jgi:hypothetical protein